MEADLTLSSHHYYGDIHAPIQLIEFGDFECHDCGEAYEHVQSLLREFGEVLCLQFRHMPLDQLYPMHPHSTLAAQAAEAAGRQGMFWQMYDMLFTHQLELAEDDLFAYAEELGLSAEQFAADLESDEVRAIVRADVLAGSEQGVIATPTFFLNGERIKASLDYAALKERITQLLATV